MNGDNDVREITGKSGRIKLAMTIRKLSQDICILLWGGSSHVGAVVVAVPSEKEPLLWSIDLPHHKDMIIARQIALRVCNLRKQKVTVVCGIHYDNITKNEIQSIIQLSEEMAGKAVSYLEENQ